MNYRLLAIVGLTASVLSANTAYAERTVRLSYYLNPQHVYARTALEPFATEVQELTGGEIVIETYPSEQLGKAGDTVRAIQSGIADIGFVALPYHAQEMPATQAINLPFGYDAHTAAGVLWRAAHEEGVIHDEWERLGLVPLMFFANPPYEVHSTDIPLPDYASLQGLKLRSPGAPYVATIKRLGAVPYEIATPDQYEALQRGLINSTIYTFSSWESFRMDELLNHTTVGNNIVTTGLSVVTTQKFMDSLTQEQRAMMIELGRKYSQIGTDAAVALNNKALETYKVAGLKTYEWSEEDKAKLVELLEGVNVEWAASAESAGIDAGSLFEELSRFEESVKAEDELFPLYE